MVKVGRNLKSLQKIFKMFLANTEMNFLQMSLNEKFHEIYQTCQKSKTRKTKILKQVCNLMIVLVSLRTDDKKHCLLKV